MEKNNTRAAQVAWQWGQTNHDHTVKDMLDVCREFDMGSRQEVYLTVDFDKFDWYELEKLVKIMSAGEGEEFRLIQVAMGGRFWFASPPKDPVKLGIYMEHKPEDLGFENHYVPSEYEIEVYERVAAYKEKHEGLCRD